VQFIEASALGVRAACYRLTSARHPIEIRLFPMIHVGTTDYYQAIRTRLETCDVILFEGVRSRVSGILVKAYEWAVRRKRLGLVTQRSALPLRPLGKTLIHADSTTAEFQADWSAIPWHWRVPITLLAPLVGAHLFFTATRESIGSRLQTEDLPAERDMQRDEDAPEFQAALITQRDSRLVKTIAKLLAQPGGASCAGIVYGAAHMRAVTRFLLDDHAYRVAHGEWIDVFTYDR
jgi:hypothetical protein